MRRKKRVAKNVLDAVIQIISLAIVQNHLATKIKRLSLEVLRAIARMTPKIKPTTKLVSWLNRQMRTKTMSFVGSSAEKATDESTIKGHGSTLPRSNANGPVFVTTDTYGIIKVLPPKTDKEVVAREMERKARTTLLMALPKDHLAKFHKMVDAKEMWEAIKSRFGGNDESNKMQKYLLKQQFEGTTASSSSTQNVAFVFAENTSSTNDISTAYSVSSSFVLKSQKEGSSSYIDEVIHSIFANQSSAPQLDYDDLEQINNDDMEEMDLKWQVAIISMRIKKFHKRTGRKLQFDTKDPVEALKEKEDLKTKFENWQNSSKNHSKLLNTQMSANDKFGLGYGDYRYGSILSYENEVLQRNYMPSGPDVVIDYSKFTYGLKQTSADESDSKPSEYASCESDSCVETSTSMPKPVENASKVVCKSKVWTGAPIIEEYESDSDNDLMSNVQEYKKT
nr:xylulose kinase-1 [Tanacetum cinerariifolium]